MVQITAKVLTNYILFGMIGYVLAIDINIIEAVGYVKFCFYSLLVVLLIIKIKKEIGERNDTNGDKPDKKGSPE